MPNTKHGKTGLHKIPLTAAELLDLDTDAIREKAKAPRTIETTPDDEWHPRPTLAELWAETDGADPKPDASATDPDAPITSGHRYAHLRKIAGALRRQGAGEETIRAAIRVENQVRCVPPKPDADLVALARDFASRYTPEPDGEFIHDAKKASSSTKERGPLSGPVLVNISDVQREEVRWLWKHRIPVGKLTVVEGDPGNGKSWLTMALATVVTQGSHLPGDYSLRKPQNVLVLTAEDGLGDTLRPRLEDMGADITRVRALTAVTNAKGQEQFPSLSRDLVDVEAALQGGGYGLVIIDPINAYLGDIDGHQDTDVRSVLGPLAQLADKYQVAVVFVRHLTKGGRDKSIYRGLGSIGYTAAARSALLVGIDPANPHLRVVVCHKHNLAQGSPGIAFEIQDGRFFWRGESTVTADAMLAPVSSEDSVAREEAADFLRETLGGGARPVKEVQHEATQIGITASTLKRARLGLGVRSGKVGFGADGYWEWRLPYGLIIDTKGTTVPNVDAVTPLATSEANQGIGASDRDPLRGRAADNNMHAAMPGAIGTDHCACGADVWAYTEAGRPRCQSCLPRASTAERKASERLL